MKQQRSLNIFEVLYKDLSASLTSKDLKVLQKILKVFKKFSACEVPIRHLEKISVFFQYFILFIFFKPRPKKKENPVSRNLGDKKNLHLDNYKFILLINFLETFSFLRSFFRFFILVFFFSLLFFEIKKCIS